MIKRLPRFAELRLATLCAESGALCHKVEEDESGWDRLIEFPRPDAAGPADTHPPRKRAYAQVKSARNQRLSCRVKLSNALGAAQSPEPWFILLVTARAGKGPVKIYAVHVWDGIMRRTLEAVRRAENEGRPLNRSWLTIPFDVADEKNDNLISWMQEAIDAAASDYAQAKKTIYRRAGYEEGCGIGQVTIEAASKDEILKNFLGLGSGLRMLRFTFTPSRFGIVSPEPLMDMHVTPERAGACEIRLRNPRRSEPIILSGAVYQVGAPVVPPGQTRFRFSAAFMEILYGLDGQAEFRAHLEPHEKTDLLTIENFARLNEWIEEGEIDIQVWLDGNRAVGQILRADKPSAQWDWAIAAGAARLLRNIAGPGMQDQIRVSLQDLGRASGLKTFYQFVETGPFRMEFKPLPGAPPQLTTVLYWFDVEIGGHVFYALVERTIMEDIMIEGKRRITAGNPRHLEAYALLNVTEAGRKMMRDDYERWLAQSEQSDSPLGLGDLRQFFGANSPCR
jgi:hypothetical protein